MKPSQIGAAVVALTLAVHAADAPYFGVWTYNSAESDQGPVQMTFERVGNDRFRLTDQARKSYEFRIDGTGHPDAYGGIATWKQKGPDQWEVSYTVDGKPYAVETLQIAPDNKAMTSRVTIQRDGGSPVDQTSILKRTSGNRGLLGTWIGKMQISPFELEIARDGDDGLIFAIRGVFLSKAKFDGKPYPMSGPVMPNGSTAAFTRLGPRSFRTIQKQPSTGTTLDATVTVSDDGRTLTEVGIDEAGVKRTWVFNRR